MPDARAILVLAACGLTGCSDSARMAVYPVAGKLLVNGQPAGNAMIVFHPLGPAATGGRLPVATTRPDGGYQLMTFEPGDGAPAGEYALTAIWPDSTRPHDECADCLAIDQLKGRYADPSKSPWRVTVRPGANEVPLWAEIPGSWSSVRQRDRQAPGAP